MCIVQLLWVFQSDFFLNKCLYLKMVCSCSAFDSEHNGIVVFFVCDLIFSQHMNFFQSRGLKSICHENADVAMGLRSDTTNNKQTHSRHLPLFVFHDV